MGVPPRGDPRRPLHLAIRSTRLLGILFLLIGTSIILFLSVSGMMPRRSGLVPAAGLLFFYVVPGAVYLVTAFYLKRRRFWAVVVGLVLASIHLILLLLAIASILISMLRGPGVPIALIPMFVMIFIILALAQLIYHLSLSFEAIKYVPVEDQHGFEPLMGQSVEPPPAGANPAER